MVPARAILERLGFPVPNAVAFFGVEEPAAGGELITSVSCHNAWIYFAMDLALVGLAAYLPSSAPRLRRTAPGHFASIIWPTRGDRRRAAALLHREAAFRQVQMNFLLGSLCAVLAKARRD